MGGIWDRRRTWPRWLDVIWALAFVGLFALSKTYELFSRNSLATLWWALYILALLALFARTLFPYRDYRGKKKRLRPAGIVLVASALAVLGALARPGLTFIARSWRLEVTLLGACFVAFLVAWAKQMEEEMPPRVIRAASDGGFVVTFSDDAGLAASAGNLPGAVPLGEGSWRVPATPEATQALLEFAKKHDFAFQLEKQRI